MVPPQPSSYVPHSKPREAQVIAVHVPGSMSSQLPQSSLPPQPSAIWPQAAPNEVHVPGTQISEDGSGPENVRFDSPHPPSAAAAAQMKIATADQTADALTFPEIRPPTFPAAAS